MHKHIYVNNVVSNVIYQKLYLFFDCVGSLVPIDCGVGSLGLICVAFMIVLPNTVPLLKLGMSMGVAMVMTMRRKLLWNINPVSTVPRVPSDTTNTHRL